MAVLYKDAFIQTDNENMTRRVLSHSPGMMLVEMTFHKMSDDPNIHSHPHQQIVFITEGKFEFIFEGKPGFIMEQGDSVYVEPDVRHGAKVLADNSKLLDIFSPRRDDFLK